MLPFAFLMLAGLPQATPSDAKLPPFPTARAKHSIRGTVKADSFIEPKKLTLSARHMKRFPGGLPVPARACNAADLTLPGVFVHVVGLETQFAFEEREEQPAIADFSEPFLGVFRGQPIRILQPEDAPFALRFRGRGVRFDLRVSTRGERSWKIAPNSLPLSFRILDVNERFSLILDALPDGRLDSPTHPWLSTEIRVLRHPVFAVTGPDGSYVLPKLPPGEYDVVATHTLLGTQRKRIRLRATDARATFTLHVPGYLRGATPVAAGDTGPRVAWRVPDAGFVAFHRVKSRLEPKAIVGTLTPPPRSAAGFYAHEVGPSSRVHRRAPELPDILASLALSLSERPPKGGRRERVRREFPSCVGLGAIRAEGTVTTAPVTDLTQVRQSGTISLAAKRGQTGKYRVARGKLTFQRTIDCRLGRVVSFDARFDGALIVNGQSKGGKRATVADVACKAVEAWTFDSLRAPDTAAFRRRTNQAIQRGEAWLASKVQGWLGEATFGKKRDAHQREVGTGALALTLLTLCKGSADRSGSAVTALLDALRRRTPIDTYVLSTALMALEAYYEPANEVEQLRQGLIDAPRPRHPQPSDLALMKAWTAKLLTCRDPTARHGILRFHYAGEPGFDNSVTQFAALGLASAARCGIALPSDTWQRLARHFLSVQST